MDPHDLPPWAQFAGIAVAALVWGLGYLKSRFGPRRGEATVVSGTFADGKLIRQLTEATEELTSEASRELRHVARAIEDNTEAMRANSDATLNMLRFLKARGVD